MKATIEAWTGDIMRGAMDPSFSRLYGDGEISFQRDRYGSLLQKMASLYGPGEVIIASTPGRTELGGNHTDHNGGRVLAAAVHLDTVAVAAYRGDSSVSLHSSGFPEAIRVDLRDLTPRDNERGTPAALVRGVAAGLVREGFRIGGFNTCVHSTVPIGTGLSSSASFEVLMGSIFNHLHNRGLVSDLFLARAARNAETSFFGKPCGFMDQTAVTLRGVLHMDFQDLDNPKAERLPGFFESLDYTLAVVDTGGSHAHLTDEYGTIRREMGDVAACFGLPSARGLSRARVVASIPRLREETGDRAILRTLHFIEENRRVEAQISALKRGWVKKFLRLVRESGNSSWKLLQNSMLPGDIRHQSLPLALALTESFLGKDGACRIHGGGFAGTIQTYVPKSRFEEYRRLMETVFGPRSVFPLRVRPAEAPTILTIGRRRTKP